MGVQLKHRAPNSPGVFVDMALSACVLSGQGDPSALLCRGAGCVAEHCAVISRMEKAVDGAGFLLASAIGGCPAVGL